MQFGFVRNPPALVSAIEKGIPLSTDDLTLAVEFLFMHPERLGASGTVAERLIENRAFHPVQLGPLLFALAGGPIESHRLQFLFQKLLRLSLIEEYHLLCATTALCSSNLTGVQKLQTLGIIASHPKRTSRVLMGRHFSLALNESRNWVGLGVIEAISTLRLDPSQYFRLVADLAQAPTPSLACQRSFVHALESISFSKDHQQQLLKRVLLWPGLCPGVQKKILYLLAKG